MIASSLGVVIYLLTILFGGNVVVSVILGTQFKPLPKRIALALAVGSGVVAVLLFWVSLAGFKPDRVVVFTLFGVFAAAQTVLLWRVRKSLVIPRGVESFSGDAISTGAVIVIAGCVLITLLNALALPVYEWDSFAIWALKAKVVALAPLNPQPDYFHDVALSYSHLDYPLLVPFLMAGVYGAMGEINDQPGKIVFPILYIAFAFQLFSALRWKLARTESLILTALAMSIPAFVRWSGAGVADVALSLYYMGALFYFLRWREDGQRANLILSILFGAFAAFTKNEGLPLMLLIAGVALLFAAIERSRKKILGAFIFIGGVLLLNLPWLWWSRTIPRIHENYAARLRLSTIIENSNRLGVILPEFLKQMWAWSRWGGVWLLLALVMIVGWRAFASRRGVFLWVVLLGQLALYVLILIVTPWDVRELLEAALDRLILQTLPVVILLIGFHWRETGGQALQREAV